MGIANQQNMIRTIPVLPQPYGIRVRLRRGDPFAKLVGRGLAKDALVFYRRASAIGCSRTCRASMNIRASAMQPALVFEKVEKLGESRSF